MHDMIAYALLAAFSCSLALRWRDDSEEYYLTIMRVMFFAFTVCLTVPPVSGNGRTGYRADALLVRRIRFAGWAENPNQLALIANIMPFFGWYLASRTPGLAASRLWAGDRLHRGDWAGHKE